jgi:hypothetical protein
VLTTPRHGFPLEGDEDTAHGLRVRVRQVGVDARAELELVARTGAEGMRVAAMLALADLGAEQTEDFFVECARDPSLEVRWVAQRALGSMRSARSLALLFSLAEEQGARAGLTNRLTAWSDDELLGLMRSASAPVLWAVARALGLRGGATLSAPVLGCFRAKWLETVVGAPEYEAVCAATAVRDDASVVFQVLSPRLACSDVRADGIRRAIAEQVRAAWSMADSDAAVVPGGFEHDTPPSRALPALGWLDVVGGNDGDAQDIRHGLGWSLKPHPLPAPRVVLSGAEGGVALLVLGYTVNPHQSRRLSEVLESDLPSARIVHLLEHQFGGHRCAQVALLGLVIILPPLVEALDPRHGTVDEWLARLDLENPGPEDLATLDAFFAQFGQFPRITRAQEALASSDPVRPGDVGSFEVVRLVRRDRPWEPAIEADATRLGCLSEGRLREEQWALLERTARRVGIDERPRLFALWRNRD